MRSKVYFTNEISSEAVLKLYKRINYELMKLFGGGGKCTAKTLLLMDEFDILEEIERRHKLAHPKESIKEKVQEWSSVDYSLW